MGTIPKSVFIVTMLLVVNTVLATREGPLWLIQTISLAGPLLIVWMVVDVLRDRSVPVRDLEPGEEWGYQDRPDLRPVRCPTPPRRQVRRVA